MQQNMPEKLKLVFLSLHFLFFPLFFFLVLERDSNLSPALHIWTYLCKKFITLSLIVEVMDCIPCFKWNFFQIQSFGNNANLSFSHQGLASTTNQSQSTLQDETYLQQRLTIARLINSLVLCSWYSFGSLYPGKGYILHSNTFSMLITILHLWIIVQIVDSIISHGCFLTNSFIEHSVVGIRSRLNSNVHLKVCPDWTRFYILKLQQKTSIDKETWNFANLYCKDQIPLMLHNLQ